MSIDPETTIEKILRSGGTLLVLILGAFVPFWILWVVVCAAINFIKGG